MNKVILMGRLTRNPEVRYTSGENSLAIAELHHREIGIFQSWRYYGMDKDTLQKAQELERDIKSITRILEEHNKHHWVQVVSPKTDDGQSERFQNDLAEWLRQRKEIYEKELADL
jgi:hypothetical protein